MKAIERGDPGATDKHQFMLCAKQSGKLFIGCAVFVAVVYVGDVCWPLLLNFNQSNMWFGLGIGFFSCFAVVFGTCCHANNVQSKIPLLLAILGHYFLANSATGIILAEMANEVLSLSQLSIPMDALLADAFCALYLLVALGWIMRAHAMRIIQQEQLDQGVATGGSIEYS